MKTLPREPWRGGQICGYQTAYGLPWSIFCGEFKKLGSPWCEEHDREERAETEDGSLPKVAKGNALGLRLGACSESWLARDAFDEIVATERTRFALEERLGFSLSWETEDPDAPQAATPEEIAAWEAS